MRRLGSGIEDAQGLFDMAREEEDADTLAAVDGDLDKLERQLEELEFHRMFSGEMDEANAFLDIQAGSGGTEALVSVRPSLRSTIIARAKKAVPTSGTRATLSSSSGPGRSIRW